VFLFAKYLNVIVMNHFYIYFRIQKFITSHNALLIYYIKYTVTGATREEAKKAEAPPLAKPKLRKKIKYLIVLVFLCLSDLKLRNFTNLWS